MLAQASTAVTSRLALGTVQFGLPYGVANRTGQISLDEARAILSCAANHGIDTLDTAIAYGDSERRLGEVGVERWRVITKLPPVPQSCSDVAAWARECIAGSLARLRSTKLHGLLLHRALDLLAPTGDALYRELRAQQQRGVVEQIGVSVYGPEELEALCSRFEFDLIQAPFNVVDRRLADSGWLTRLQRQRTEVHVRSVFLQGLLLMEPDARPARFAAWQALWDTWQRWLADSGLTPLQACLAFALSHAGIARVVVGVDREAQLAEILASATTRDARPPAALTSCDAQLINPLSWIQP